MKKLDYSLWTAYGLLIIAQILVGGSIVGTKYLMASMPVLFLLVMRFALAAGILFPLHWILDPNPKNILLHFRQLTPRDWLFLIGQAVCAGVLFNFLMILGLRYTDAHVAGIITSALPAIIAVMSWLILKERFTRKTLFCVFLATIGLLIISVDNLQTLSAQQSLLGNMLVFLSLLPEATYYILTKKHPVRLPIFLMSSFINALNALVVLPITLYYLDPQSLQFSSFDWFILVVISIASGLFYVCWYLGAIKAEAVMSSLATAVMPVATVTVAWLCLGETIDELQLLGMVFVVGSIGVFAIR